MSCVQWLIGLRTWLCTLMAYPDLIRPILSRQRRILPQVCSLIPLSILQNTDNSLLEEIATNFGVSLGHDNVAIANISLIKARELAQEALHRADMKRRTQQEQKKEGLDVQRVEVHAANSETEAPLHMRWTGGT